MRLKTKLTLQNVLIIAVTICTTLSATLIYGYFYERFTNKPAPGLYNTGLVIITKGENVVYASSELSDLQLRSAMIDMKMGNQNISINGQNYLVSGESFGLDNREYAVYTLTPSISFSSYYKSMAFFLICVFLIAFILAAQAVARQNRKQIIAPVSALKESTQKLAAGELDTVINHEGIGEIAELCDSVELLRLKLKESVYYRQKSDDSRKFLISGISHDLRTPVTAVRGYIEGLLDGVAITEEKKQAYLEAALKKTDTITMMIDDLLLYSKLDLNTLPFERTQVSLAEYLQDYVIENQTDYQRKNKTLLFHNELTSDVFVQIDCPYFNRVLQNILSNAEKNIAEGTGKTEIFLRENHSSAIIEIRDNGNGIKKEDLPNIFTRFYRGDSARKVDGSSGLGLTIAKQIIEGLGGRIWALSEEGNGTSILISLKKS